MPNQPPNYVIGYEPDTTTPSTVNTVVNEVPDLLPPFPINVPAPPAGTQYTAYGVTVTYNRDRGLRSAPVAAPYITPIAVWRMHGGMVYKVVEWVAKLMNGVPPIPQPITNANEVLMSEQYSIPSNEVGPDGVLIWTRAGRYTFFLKQAPADSDFLYGAVLPQDVSGVTNNYISPAEYLAGLIGPIPNPGGFGGGPIMF